jgi:hypothetical protein
MGVRRTTKTARTSPKRIAMAKRRALVLKLREQGLGFHQIARRVGTSVPACYRDLVAGMAEITRQPALLTLRSFPRAPANSFELQAERVSGLDRSGRTTHYCLKAVLVAPSTPGT